MTSILHRAAVVSLVAAVLSAGPAVADEVADFYKGKTFTIVVGHEVGTGFEVACGVEAGPAGEDKAPPRPRRDPRGDRPADAGDHVPVGSEPSMRPSVPTLRTANLLSEPPPMRNFPSALETAMPRTSLALNAKPTTTLSKFLT